MKASDGVCEYCGRVYEAKTDRHFYARICLRCAKRRTNTKPGLHPKFRRAAEEIR